MEKGDQIHYSLRKVSKIRRKGGVVFELNIPALRIRRGQCTAFVGQSGCGKSTLLDLLALVLRPTEADEFLFRIVADRPDSARFERISSGSAYLHKITSLNDMQLAHIRRSEMGYVLQSGGLLPFLTVRDNILLPCALNDVADQRQILQQLAARLNIADQLTKKPRHLSGGQRQRAAIARALAHRPSVVLADEPTAAVDRINAREIGRIFKALAEEMAVTLLLASHDQQMVSATADRVFMFQVEKIGPTSTRSTLIEST